MKDIILQCACCHKEITDLSAAGWRNGERRSFECPECGCRTKVEAEVWLRLSSDAEETWRELYRLVRQSACETWFDPDGALRVYGADDLGGRELAALWIAPEPMATRRPPDCMSRWTAAPCRRRVRRTGAARGSEGHLEAH